MDWKIFFKITRTKLIILFIFIIVPALGILSMNCLTHGAPCHAVTNPPFWCSFCLPYSLANIFIVIDIPIIILSLPVTFIVGLISNYKFLSSFWMIPILIPYWYIVISLIIKVINHFKEKKSASFS